jgi:hypothetical protein
MKGTLMSKTTEDELLSNLRETAAVAPGEQSLWDSTTAAWAVEAIEYLQRRVGELEAGVEKALIQINGCLCSFSREAKHAHPAKGRLMERPDLAKIDEDRGLALRKWLACAGPTATLQDLPDYLKNLDIVITYCYHLETRVKMADTSAQELHAELMEVRSRLSELKVENERLQFEIDEHSFTPEPEEGPWS